MTATESIREGQPAVARAYQYKHGDRPLDGFTIQRGAGRGGFGEVYYALSDSGREVALKLIQIYEQIEMRGVSQCMNLKSPHLVTIFDVKYGEDGRPWVIMEYVAGPSLRELLDAAPSGLGTQKSAFFLREIGKGLTYLHDCGIVHRDLKPGNIFYENGYVKIGDYGLSKAISTSQHSGQTVTVGTVHYMAPEVGAGKYDRGIDIYALGALLYEMLTGQVPFFGASPAEVLMKHLSSEPDLSNIEEPFHTVIHKAMAKDPAQRYQSVQEMVEAVFGEEHVRNSVSHFSPESLSIVAGHAAQKIGTGNPGSFTPSDVQPAGTGKPQCGDQWKQFADRFEQMGARWTRFGEDFAAKHAWCGPKGRVGKRGAAIWTPAPQVLDPMPPGQRIVLGGLTIVLSAFAGGLLGGSPGAGGVALFAVLGATLGATLAKLLIVPSLRYESLWVTRLAVGGFCAIPAVLLSLPSLAGGGRSHGLGGTLAAVIMGLLMLHWEERISPARQERVSIGNLFTAALLGLILSSMFGGNQGLAAVVLAGTSLAVSLSSAWAPRPTPSPAIPAPAGSPPPPPPSPNVGVLNAQPPPTPVAMPQVPPLPAIVRPMRPVPRLARPVWLVLFMGLVTTGLMLWASLAFTQNNANDASQLFAFGLGSIIGGAFSLKRSSQRFFVNYWEYLIRPVVQLACAQSVIASLAMMMFGNTYSNDVPPLVFFTVFPAIVFFVVTFIVGRGGNMTQTLIPPNSSIVLPARGEPFTISGFVFGLSRFAATILGSAVLLFSLLIALAVVADIPGLMASGIIDRDLPHELNRAFDTTTWPHLMRQAGGAASFITAVIGTGLLLLARRKWGAPHMFRALAGVGLLFLAVIALGRGLPGWSVVRDAGTPGDEVGAYVQMIRTPHLLQAAGLVVFSMFLFLWPARKNTAPYQQQQQQQGTAAQA